LETGSIPLPAGAAGLDNSPVAKSAALFAPCYLLLEKLSNPQSLIVIARFSVIVSLFLSEYVPVSKRFSTT
jgi:hypothetical protein